MLALRVEIDSMLTPGMQVSDELKLLTRRGMERVSDSETSTQTTRIGCS